MEEINNLKEEVIVAASLKDSSSDPDSDSDDHSIDEVNTKLDFIFF